MALFTSPMIAVLIETYWNVNEEWADQHYMTKNCINRNILECKYLNRYPSNFGLGINRNILECKCRWKQKQEKDIHRINRNILECKFRCGCASGD